MLPLLALPAASAAVDYACSGSGSEQTCTIPAGNYTTKVQKGFWSTDVSYTVTNDGTFDVTIPVPDDGFNVVLTFENSGINGADSSDDDAGSGTSSGPLSFTNAGAITQTGGTGFINDRVPGIHAWTQGGNGGDYTNDNAKHNAGAPGNAGTMEFVNDAEVLIWYPSLAGGVALLAESLGGAGGNVTSIGPDHNGNPQYHNQVGTGGGSASAVTMTNNASVTAEGLEAVTGYWAVAARSIGGDGGTGNDGTPGGGAGAVTIDSGAAVSVDLYWTEPPATPPAYSPAGAYALYAASLGGNGNMSVNSGNDGGAGGNADAVTVDLSSGGNVSVTARGTASDTSAGAGTGAAIAALSSGGAGGAGYDSSTGGKGGNAGPVSVTADGANATGSGDGIGAIVARAAGGSGGDGGIGQDHSNAGAGGSTGHHTDTSPAVSLHLTDAQVTTDGSKAAGIVAVSRGGTGGDGTDYSKALSQGTSGGHGGGGGNTGPLTLTLDGNGRVQTQGAQAPAVIALARGGNGGQGGDLAGGEGDAGDGGTGGQGAPVQVHVSGGIGISTNGGPADDGSNPAVGILAQSSGGTGGTGGELNVDEGGAGADGGYGGGGYAVSVTVDSGASISTTGADAVGVVAQSLSGAGGDAGEIYQGGLGSSPGTGGASGSTGAVTVTQAGTLTTTGESAMGILAQSMPGNGGGTQEVSGYGVNPGDSGGSSGSTGSVGVANSGGIATQGQFAHGIAAQAIGGGGGAGGGTSGSIISSIGGDGGFGSNGGAVSLTNSGSITTAGDFALGVLGQSIGGGGGDGGDASGVISSVGGSGEGGGNGGTVSFTQTAGHIGTGGRLAHALVAQSIGGGGGNAGNATATSAEATLAIGGTGGGGGNGGTVALSVGGGKLTTAASKAAGVVAQSLGGGGGTGGAAQGLSGGIEFSAAVAVGGSGGNGGDAGATTVRISNAEIIAGQFDEPAGPTNLLPVDGFGVVAQSIGGGGGSGGSAAAQALSEALPSPKSGTAYSLSLSGSAGGSGGKGGAGNTVAVSVADGATVQTQGQGAHGLLAHSVGGGGGTGGDSSALSATLSYGRAATAAVSQVFTADVAVAVGGSGNVAGDGGAVTVEVGGQQGSAAGPASVTTYGDYADGVLAQSIGDGGGNAGIGSTTTVDFGATRNLHVGLGLGGSSGKGGDGSTVTATLYPQGSITTYGASSVGIAAQSIGGGGGAAQGGTINLGGSYTTSGNVAVTPAATFTATWGATGAGGGDGGDVSVTVQGGIDTYGGDAAGVLAQSLGGGGGLGGSAGAEASADNPVSTLTGLREFVSDVVEKNLAGSLEANLTLGGRGGAGGDGGQVSLVHAGRITTRGDWAQGLVAQSIGHGGGKGGSAASNTSGTTVSLALALGGSGGGGGSGGAVDLTLDGGAITTGLADGSSGYSAFGVLAQSIGGGGGLGTDGSNAATGRIAVGQSGAGSGGNGSDGGSVTLGGNGGITTYGDAAHAVVLQSIGGGGGIGATGSSESLDALLLDEQIDLGVGGTDGASGSGKAVTVDDAALAITTAGDNAFGVLAQSIGGGGGLASTPGNVTTSVSIGGTSPADGSGNGGTVEVTLAQSSIRTSGRFAHAVVAQSIGGGGGIGGYPTAAPAYSLPSQYAMQGADTSGNGGTVTVDVDGTIQTTGSGAHGILAQSIGTGGGLRASGSTVYAGPYGGIPYYDSNAAGPVSITQSGSLTASGENAAAIFAQSMARQNPSAAYTYDGKAINITINGSVQGGSGDQGVGVWTSGGSTTEGDNWVRVNAGGQLGALSGQAVRHDVWEQTPTMLYLYNDGIVTGAVDLGGGQMQNNGTWNQSGTSTADVVNAGLVVVGDRGTPDRARLVGDFTQTSAGTLALDVDFRGGRADRLNVTGDVRLDGRVAPLLGTISPGTVPVMTVDGAFSGQPRVDDSALFRFDLTRSGRQLLLSSGADFAPASFGLDPVQRAVAGHLQSIWDQGSTPAFDDLFWQLGLTADADPGAYGQDLRQLSPDATLAIGARGSAAVQEVADRAFSCPVFSGTGAMLTETSCGWVILVHGSGRQARRDGVSGFSIDTTTLQLGGQIEIAPGWLAGGSLAYVEDRFTSRRGRSRGDGQSGYGALTLKHEVGPWLLAAAAFGGYGSFDTRRVIDLPGVEAVAAGTPERSTLGLRLRAAYTLGGQAVYLRPSLEVGALRVRSGAYRERSAGGLGLDVESSARSSLTLTPAIEIGGRIAVDDLLLRPYLRTGVSWRSAADWEQRARLLGAPSGTAGFVTTVPGDRAVARIGAGIQLYSGDNLDLRLQYTGEVSDHYTAHRGSLTASLRF